MYVFLRKEEKSYYITLIKKDATILDEIQVVFGLFYSQYHGLYQARLWLSKLGVDTSIGWA